MIAYNKEWINNLLIKEEIKTTFNQHHISADEYSAAINLFPVGFYTPNIFIRAGLFFLTLIIIAFTFGLILIPFFDAHLENIFITLCLIFSVLCYLLLEFFVRKKYHFRSGVDDALLWASGGFLFAALQILRPDAPTIIYLPIVMLSIYLVCRFSNTLMGAVIVLSMVMVLPALFFTIVGASAIIINLLMFSAAGLIYFLSKKLLVEANFKIYKNALLVIEFASLVFAYRYINYYAVVITPVYGNLKIPIGLPIFYSVLLWLLTVGLPAAYIYYGIKIKDQLLGRVGLLLLVAVVFTIREFYSILPIEILMITGGMILIPMAYYLGKYLQKQKHGFISSPLPNSIDKLQVDALIITETFNGMAQPANNSTNLGGGSFGGGGASGDF